LKRKSTTCPARTTGKKKEEEEKKERRGRRRGRHTISHLLQSYDPYRGGDMTGEEGRGKREEEMSTPIYFLKRRKRSGKKKKRKERGEGRRSHTAASSIKPVSWTSPLVRGEKRRREKRKKGYKRNRLLYTALIHPEPFVDSA